MIKKPSAIFTCALSTLFLGMAPAAWSQTTVNPIGAGSGSERCLAGTYCPGNGAYAGARSLLGVFESEVGKGTFTRVNDAFDTVWKAAGSQPVMIRALARYAGDSSVVGIDAGSGYQGLTQTIANNKVRVDHPGDYLTDPRNSDFSSLPAGGGWSSIALASGQSFAFILNDLTVGYKISSNSALAGYANSGKSFLDYMVTWQVNDSIPHFFIAWEDRDPRNNTTSDHDYNDLVLEVLYASPDMPVSHAPEPATLALLLLGFPVIVVLARRRRTG